MLRIPPIGIASWLAIAFIAVAAFVLMASSLTRRETVVVLARSTPPRVAPAPAAAETVPRVAVSWSPPEVSLSAAADAADLSRTLGVALERFRAVARERLVTDASHVVQDYAAARRALQGAVAAPARGTGARRVARYLERHAGLVELADRRRGQHAATREHATRLVAEIERSVDGALRIFGRVVIRQALKDLSREAETIRRTVDDLAVADGYGPQTVSLLQDAEGRFEAILDRGRKVLRRGEGDAWLAAVDEAFTQTVLARRALVKLDEQRASMAREAQREAGALDQFVAQSARSARSVDPVRTLAGAVREPAVVATTPGAALATRGPGKRYKSGAARKRGGYAAASTRFHVESAPEDADLSQLMRIVGALVVGLLFAACVAIALGIVRPIRRLVAAVEGVARGAPATRVARGGIREFDTLADAFNRMAGQLEAARRVADEYRRSLEDRVEQRTQQLQHLADHDPLTGLPNRRRLLEVLEHELEQARSTSSCVGVYFLDLDNFKHVNDTMGHAFGDRLLRGIADRLRGVIGSHGQAARFGGDEFTVIQAGAGIEDLQAAGWALVHAFQSPVRVDERELLIGVSVGASLYPQGQPDAATLLREADAALFRAKQLGRGQLALFTPDLLEFAASRFTTEQNLRRAVERGEFELVFQPEIDAVTHRVELVEALLRWRLPDGRLASPGEFLSVAEETGLILEISDWVLEAAILAVAHWRRSGRADLRVAINVSPRQLLDASFVDRVRLLLDQHGLPPEAIEIELTENVVQTGAATVDALRRLRQLGVGIALDDFGSGYSSLASLEQLPLTRVKLDRSLIEGIDDRDRSRAIARSLAQLCADLGLQLTAEGIERPEQLRYFLGVPGVKLQGYLLSRPLAADAVLGFAWAPPEGFESWLLEVTPIGKPRPAVAAVPAKPAIRQAS